MRADRDPAHVAPYRRPWWARLLGRLLEPWIGLTIEPPVPSQLIDGRPVCYVLEDYGLSNALILERACREAGLPSPLRAAAGRSARAQARLRRAVAPQCRQRAQRRCEPGAGPPATARRTPARWRACCEAHRDDPALDVQLVPVSIFVGRAPDKNSGWFSVLFSENWTLVGRFRRLLAILLNGRDTLVQFAPPVRPARDRRRRTCRPNARCARSRACCARTSTASAQRSSARTCRRGACWSTRCSPPTRCKEAIADQARREKGSKGDQEAWKKAHAFAYEIAADYSHPVVRSVSFLLTSVWNRIYRGVLVHHLDDAQGSARPATKSSTCPATAATWTTCC